MLISPFGWSMLFIIPALVTFLNGNGKASILIVFIGAVFGFGYWLGSLQGSPANDQNSAG